MGVEFVPGEGLDDPNFNTKYEALLKFMLEKRGISVQQNFTLDHPFGKNTYDLMIPEYKLIIEVDGAQHLTNSKQKESDLWRRRTARDHGYRMLHFTNRQIFLNPTKVIEMIRRYRPDGPRGLDRLRKI